MNKKIAVLALLIILNGTILAAYPSEVIREEVIDEWNPIRPPTLNPYSMPENATGWAFTILKPGGNFLEFNVTASAPVRIRVGLYGYNESGKPSWLKLLLDHVDTYFTGRIPINESEANFLEIRNEKEFPVSISGSVRKIGFVNRTMYPYSGLGTMIILLGSAFLIYGIASRPKRERLKARRIKISYTYMVSKYKKRKEFLRGYNASRLFSPQP
jgi:hypothetical protein